jgi:Methyltransferase domain
MSNQELTFMQLSTIGLTQKEHEEINRLLAFSEHSPIEVTDLWRMMDIVWDEMGCDSDKLTPEKISAYYSHPVWTLNGLFIEQDDVSMGHREAIASWIVNNQIASLLDYGGGFGTLARLIATKESSIKINIHEPFPSQLAMSKMKEFPNVTFVSSADQDYDCIICVDVLEHVDKPLELFAAMIESAKVDGYLVVANCFYPDIKCHLPSTFHFRHTFDVFAKMMGLQVVGICKDSHAKIYRRIEIKEINWKKIYQLEQLSKTMFPVNQLLSASVKQLKKTAKFFLLK